MKGFILGLVIGFGCACYMWHEGVTQHTVHQAARVAAPGTSV